MDVEPTTLDEVLAEEVEGYDPEEAVEATEEWLERVPPGDDPVEDEAETGVGSET